MTASAPSRASNSWYRKLRRRARYLAGRYPTVAFYRDFSRAIARSAEWLFTDHLAGRLTAFAAAYLPDNAGHGMDHAVKVARDAGALMLIELGRRGVPAEDVRRRVRVVHCAGLLHDIKRTERDHAIRGARFVRAMLRDAPLNRDEIEDIAQAIRNHEAFVRPVPANTIEGRRVAACLYDADKFRWGPDNFTDTIWEMAAAAGIPPATFLAAVPRGMEKLEAIKTTFRTRTGRRYGPAFIDRGLAIGAALFDISGSGDRL